MASREIAWDGAPFGVNVLHASGEHPDESMLPALELRADLEVMVRPEPARSVPVEDGLRRDAVEHQRVDLRGVAADDVRDLIAAGRRRPIARTGIVVLVQDEPARRAPPTRCDPTPRA